MTTWLEDASANRHIKTYVKDFLDISGNFTVRNNYEDYKWNSYGQLMSGVYESDGAVYYGLTVDMDATGTTIAVGGSRDNTDGADAGVVRVYRYDSDAEVWYQLGNNLVGDSSIDTDFGWQGIFLSDDGTILAVNDYGSTSSSGLSQTGKIYVFQYNADTNNWDNYGDNQTELEGTSATQLLGDYGIHMSGDGSTIAAAERLNDHSVRIKKLVNGSWTSIGDTGVVGAANYDHTRPSLNYDGSRVVFNDFSNQLAYVYDYSGSGTTWTQVGSAISNSGGNGYSSFTSMNKAGDIIAIHEQTNQTIRIYQFVDTDWVQLGSTLSNSYGSSGYFGEKMRLNAAGDMIIVGDLANATVDIFKYQNYDWVQIGDTIAGIAASEFGRAVAISDDGTKIVAGGFLADLNGTNSGYVQAFQWSRESTGGIFMDISGNTMTVDCNNSKKDVNAYITNQLGNTLYGEAANDHFGIVAEMNKDGSVVAIGAKGVSSGDGAVYVYTYQSGVWQQKGSTISPYSSFSNSQFGFGVDINDDGNVIVTGSTHHYNDNGASVNDAGSLDVFEFTNGDWVQKGRSFKGIAVDDHLGLFSASINGAGNIIAGLFHMSGFVRVYQYDDDTSDWVQMGGDIPMTPGVTTVAEYNQTRRIDLSEDGTIIALGDVEDDTTGTNNGKITIYKYTVVDNVGSWNKLGDDIVSPTDSTHVRVDAFGGCVSLSSDGHTVAFNSLLWNTLKGLARIFKYSEEGNVWTQLGTDFNTTTVANVGGGTYIARTIGLSGDGKTFIHGDTHNNVNGSGYGAVHVHKYFNGQWNQIHTEYGTAGEYSYFGINGVSMSRDGTRFVASSGAADDPGTDQGYSRMFEITKEPTFKIENNRVQMKATTIRGHVGIGTAAAASTGSALVVLGANPSHNTTVYPINITTATNSFTEVQEGIGTGMSFSVGSVAPYVKPIHTSRISCYGGANIPGTTDVWKMGLETRDRDTIAEHITCIYNRVGINQTTPVYNFDVVGTIRATSFATSSDDRLKVNEQKIEGALTTLQKLVPQTYTKYEKFDISGNKTTTDLSSNSVFEAGLIAQEIYYNAPELRHLVSAGNDPSATNFHPQEYDLSGNDIQHDPDYTALGWGNDSVSVNYTQLIPYLIKAIQEQKELIDTQASQIDSLLTDITVLENE